MDHYPGKRFRYRIVAWTVISIACAGVPDADKFLGEWDAINSGDYVTITKEGSRFRLIDRGLTDTGAGVFVCDAEGDRLRCSSNQTVEFLASTGNIIWRSMEMAPVKR
jgi:hypothetical protein